MPREMATVEKYEDPGGVSHDVMVFDCILPGFNYPSVARILRMDNLMMYLSNDMNIRFASARQGSQSEAWLDKDGVCSMIERYKLHKSMSSVYIGDEFAEAFLDWVIAVDRQNSEAYLSRRAFTMSPTEILSTREPSSEWFFVAMKVPYERNQVGLGLEPNLGILRFMPLNDRAHIKILNGVDPVRVKSLILGIMEDAGLSKQGDIISASMPCVKTLMQRIEGFLFEIAPPIRTRPVPIRPTGMSS